MQRVKHISPKFSQFLILILKGSFYYFIIAGFMSKNQDFILEKRKNPNLLPIEYRLGFKTAKNLLAGIHFFINRPRLLGPRTGLSFPLFPIKSSQYPQD